MARTWNDWWRRRGDERIALLLWAVWNPIGPVPLDEYENYTGQVVQILRRAHAADLQLSPPGAEVDDSIQRQRNARYAASVEDLVTLLGKLRHEQMGMPPQADADRRAAETLFEWYEWEMHALNAPS